MMEGLVVSFPHCSLGWFSTAPMWTWGEEYKMAVLDFSSDVAHKVGKDCSLVCGTTKEEDAEKQISHWN